MSNSKVVPVEPTDKMLAAGSAALYAYDKASLKLAAEMTYKAMLSAAPAPEQDWQQQAKAAEAKVAELKRGEYICKQCGLRKDAEFTPGDF